MIVATAVAVPGWLLTRARLSRGYRARVHRLGSGLRGACRDLPAPGRPRRWSRWPGRDRGAPGAGAQAVAVVAVTPGETLRVRVGGWGGTAVGSTPGAGGWNGGGDGGEASGYPDGRPGKAGSGGGGATDVRQGGDGLEHRIIVAAGGSGGAGGAIGGPHRNGWRRRRRPPRARRCCTPRDCEPCNGRKRRNRDDRGQPGPECLGPRGHGDGGGARGRRQRCLGRRERRRRRWRRALRRRGRGRQLPPSAAGTVAAARDSAPRERPSGPAPAAATVEHGSPTTPTATRVAACSPAREGEMSRWGVVV